MTKGGIAQRQSFVVHLEDEPWDHEHIVKELREGLFVLLNESDKASIVLKREGPRTTYPLHWRLTWTEGVEDYLLDYCFVMSREQLESRIGPSNNSLYILDVMRINSRGYPISTWRSSVAALTGRVANPTSQIRLYTAFEMESEHDHVLADDGVSVTHAVEMPEVIDKGDPTIIDFVMNFARGLQ